MELITAYDVLPSPARVEEPRREPFRIGLVQQRWHPDPAEHRAALREGVRMAATEGARLVCLQELTLSPYFAVVPDDPEAIAEDIPGGPTTAFAAELARETGAWVQASLYERDGDEEMGFNTAVCVAPNGSVAARTRKQHIPQGAGYHEDHYFRPGDSGTPVIEVGEGGFGFPTCWDQWFPELARSYSLAGAEVLVYPTAIGSEPDHPDFDTQPLWQHVITGNGIANGTFMVAVNRIGDEPPLRFYGSSFVSDPYGRILAQAPRDRPAVIVTNLDLDQRRDWLALFPFLDTRRPDAYGALVDDRELPVGVPRR